MRPIVADTPPVYDNGFTGSLGTISVVSCVWSCFFAVAVPARSIKCCHHPFFLLTHTFLAVNVGPLCASELPYGIQDLWYVLVLHVAFI